MKHIKKNGYYGYSDYDLGFGRGWDPFLPTYKEKPEDIVRPDVDSWTEYDIKKEVRAINQKTDSNGNLVKLNSNQEAIKDFMGRDVYKMYYNDSSEMKIQPKDHQLWWYYSLMYMNNYLIKSITEKSKMKSMIAMRITLEVLNETMKENPNFMTEQNKKDLNKSQKNKKEGKDPGEGLRGQNAAPGGRTDYQMQQMMDKIINQVSKEISEITSMANYFGFDLDNGDNSHVDVKQIYDNFKNFNVSKRDIEYFVKNSLNKFKRSFGGKRMSRDIGLFDADEIDEIYGLEYLVDHRLSEELDVTENEYSLKFDVYIDESGSMSHSYSGSNCEITGINLCKILWKKMDMIGYVGDTYMFANNLSKVDKDKVMGKFDNGGTNIEKVVQNIIKCNRPAVVLTDLDGHISTYTDKAYFVALGDGLNRNNVLDRYAKNDRIVAYNDGKFIKVK